MQKGAEIIGSVIRGPAIIGEETRIVNSYIGPFTSIYHHVLVEKSEIEHSIVLEHSRIVDIPQRIENSLIGRNVEIARSPLLPKAYKMTLGDNSKVGLCEHLLLSRKHGFDGVKDLTVTLVYPGITGKGFNSLGQGMDSGWISHGLAILAACAKAQGFRRRPARPARPARLGPLSRTSWSARSPTWSA